MYAFQSHTILLIHVGIVKEGTQYITEKIVKKEFGNLYSFYTFGNIFKGRYEE